MADKKPGVPVLLIASAIIIVLTMLSFQWRVRVLPRNYRAYERKAAELAGLLGVREDDEACVTVCGDRRIRSLNRKYRRVDETTDVLAFPCDEPRTIKAGPARVKLAAGQQPLLLGDVVVNLRQVERQARSNGNRPLDEFVAVAAHGMLHLLGFGHQTTREGEAMEEHERRMLDALGLEVVEFGH